MITLDLLTWISLAAGPYQYGDSTRMNRPYGKVLLVVDCESIRDNSISVLEYKGEKQHGIAIHFDSLWRKIDSSFFISGKENANTLFWDSIGNIRGRVTYKNGFRVGKEEYFRSPGKLGHIKHYDSKGELHGPLLEWWPNGNKRREMEHHHGRLKHSMEWYPDGKPREKYSVHFRKATDILLHRRISSKENWAYDGRPAGKVVNGAGEVLIFQLDEDKRVKEVIHEVYRDSVVKDVEVLDTAQAYHRLDSLAAAKKP